MKAVFKLLPVFLLSTLVMASSAQPLEEKNPPKPYKILTTGRQLTIKSNRNIKNVMLWTTGGNRVIEHKDVNNQSCILEIPPVSQKTFFMMIAMNDGKIYTEKIGIR